MANINGVGIPTRETAGAVGDIYTDTKTGMRYKCVFAYFSSSDDTCDCEWEAMKTNDKSNVVERIKETPKTLEKNTDEEKLAEEPTTVSRRTNYASYSNKKK